MSEKPVIVPISSRRSEPMFDASGMLRRRVELTPSPAENPAPQPRARAAAD